MKGSGSGLREAARALLEDAMTEPQFGRKWGGGIGGSKQEKSQCQMGKRMGSLLISCLFSLQRISGKQRPGCLSFSQCRDEDALFGDMEMNVKRCNTARLHAAGIFSKPSLRDSIATKSRSQGVFQKQPSTKDSFFFFPHSPGKQKGRLRYFCFPSAVLRM